MENRSADVTDSSAVEDSAHRQLRKRRRTSDLHEISPRSEEQDDEVLEDNQIDEHRPKGTRTTTTMAQANNSGLKESVARRTAIEGSTFTPVKAKKAWVSGTAFSMSGIIEAVLPFDVKLRILEEYVRLTWTSRIPKLENPFEMCAPTNRATLIHPWVRERPEYGWCVVPITTRNSTTYSLRPPLQGTWHQLANSRDCGQGLLGDRLSDRIQIEKILEVSAHSKHFHPPLLAFFFGHMTWQFRFPEELARVLLPQGGQQNGPFPQALAHIKNVSLRDNFRHGDYLDPWQDFQPLLLQMHSAITRSKTFKNLEYLELIIETPMRLSFIHKSPMELRVQELRRRIRFMVTLCYQIVQERPKLKLHFRSSCRGRSSNFFFRPDQSVPPPAAPYSHLKPEEYESVLGFSKHEIEEFRIGTSPMLSSFVENPLGQLFEHSGEALDFTVYWQMLLVTEWRKIWDQGTDLEEKDGGYAAVYDCPDDAFDLV